MLWEMIVRLASSTRMPVTLFTDGIANWWDFARDLLFLINQKQQEMPQPLVGIGHSMGGSQLYDHPL